MKFSGVGTIRFAVLLVALVGALVWRHDVTDVAAQTPAAHELHETYDLAVGGTVAVSNVSGYIRITSWEENRVKVDAIKRGRNQDDAALVEIQVITQPNRVELRTIYPRGRSNNTWVDYDVKVPRSAILNSLSSISGDITVSDSVARVTARSTSGNVTVREVTGDAFLTTTSGNIRADRIGGALTIGTNSGELFIGEVNSTLNARSLSSNIRVTGVRDDVTANTLSGNVELKRIGGRATARSTSGLVTINDVGGDVVADSTSDSVTVTDVRGRVTANTLSGNVIIRQAQEGVRATAVSGSIQLTDVKGRIEVNSTSDEVILTNIDSRDVVAKSNSGSVRFTGKIYDDGRYEFVSFSSEVLLLVPPDSNFNLTATSHSGSINTEFPLQLGPGSKLGERGAITGTIGKGGAEVRAASFSGSVIIRKNLAANR